ncbi:hypothetical protein CHUAL_006663 [Chamberlinius hualienensis]
MYLHNYRMYIVFIILSTTCLAVANQASCDQLFNSYQSKSGNFTSPGYPSPYPARINCRYTFVGRGRERVQIIFNDFDLYKPFDDTKECEGVDAVMAFIHINGVPERIDNFCGKQEPKQLMSNGPFMYLEFRSYPSSSMSRGFRAMFKFITDFGVTAGRLDAKSGNQFFSTAKEHEIKVTVIIIACGFVFNSSETINGTFLTPNFPGYYPRNTECHYFFHGKKKERLRIKFLSFDVEGIPPCTSTTASDYVEFSNFPSYDRKMARLCGSRAPLQVESERNYFRVTFKSNNRFDGIGFEATYEFVNFNAGNSIMKVIASSIATKNQTSFITMIIILSVHTLFGKVR